MIRADALGRALDSLSDPYRRQLLVALIHDNPHNDSDTDPMDLVGDRAEDAEVLRSMMVHSHLPMLDERAYIEWDRETNSIRTGQNWTEIESVLRILGDHRDELPEGGFDSPEESTQKRDLPGAITVDVD
mgnify:CR=1 FL=1